MKGAWKSISQDGKSVTLVPLSTTFPRPDPRVVAELSGRGSLGRAAIIDVETTGGVPDLDEIIEISVLVVLYDNHRRKLVGLEEVLTELGDPGRPLPAFVTQLTGLTDEELSGKQINWSKIGEYLSRCNLAIAHHARFDRSFLDRYVRASKNLTWACSHVQIPWLALGFSSGNLELLVAKHGLFFRAHRAKQDAFALLHLLNERLPASETTYFETLVSNAFRPFVEVLIFGETYEKKAELKSLGFRWDPFRRSWALTIRKDESEKTIRAIEDLCSSGKAMFSATEIPLDQNFATPAKQIEGV